MGRRLDALDVRLLSCLQQDNQQSAEQLAEAVGRSPSPAARRVRRLREEGTIAADMSLVADDAVGRLLFAVVHVQLERHAHNEGEAFRRRLVASDNVQLCFDISGAFDILLVVAVPDMPAFNAFADEMLSGDKAVRRYESSFVKKRLKATFALPLTELTGLE